MNVKVPHMYKYTQQSINASLLFSVPFFQELKKLKRSETSALIRHRWFDWLGLGGRIGRQSGMVQFLNLSYNNSI